MKRLLVFFLALTFLFSLSVSAAENGENKYVKVWDSTLDDVPEDLWDVVYMGDMDGDGLREFAVCTDEGGAIYYLYECTGDNSYAKVWTYAISEDYCADSYVICKGDLDGDGLEEIIAGVSTTSGADHYGIHIFEWDGVVGSDNYVFQTMYNVMDGDAGSISIAGTGDFDGDGVQELFLGETRNDDIYIVSLDTLSDFSFPTWNVEFFEVLNDEADYSPWGFTWSDFDNDGYIEIVCTEWDYNALIVIQADSANAYHTELWWDDMTYPNDGAALRSLCSADLNGDGFTEIIIPSTNGTVYIIQNFGTFEGLDGVAGALDSVTTLPDITGAAIGDQDMFFGNIGEPDIYTAGYYGCYDLEYTGDDFTDGNSWTLNTIVEDPDSLIRWQQASVGDFDDDGLKDFVVVRRDGPPYIEVYEHEPLVRAGVTTTITKDSSEYFYQMRGICAGSDLDQDGKKEIFVTDYRNGGIHGFEVVGDNTIEWIWSTPDTMPGWAAVRGVTTGDLDNDGIGEVIFPVRMAGADDGFGLCIYEWDGTTDNGFNIKATSVIDDSLKTDRWRTERVTVADVDGDGVNELLYANNGSDHTKGDRFYIISFDGTFESGFYTSTIEASWNQTDDEFNGSPWYADYGDLDGDGTYEVIFAAWDHGGLFIVDVTGPDTYEKVNYILADPSLTDGVAYGGVAIADFDGDGRDEVISPMYSNYLTSILNIDGTIADATAENSVGTIRGPWLGAGIGMSAAADMNGDGKVEFYGANYSTHCYEFSYTGSDIMDPGSWTVKSVISEIEEKTALGFYAIAAVGPGVSGTDDLDGDGKGEVLVGYLESFDFDPEIWFKVAEYTEGVFVEQDWKVITPKDYKLSQNYPNPFNPNTQINFELPLAKDVTLTIYDMLGREVITLVNEHKTAGKYTVNWDGKNKFGNNASAGVYIYQLKAGHIVKNKTMTLLK